MNIRAITHLDTWFFAASLYKRRQQLFTGDEAVRFILLRKEGGEPVEGLEDWKVLDTLTLRALRAMNAEEAGAAALLRLKPMAWYGWAVGAPNLKDTLLIALPIVTNPLVHVHSGGFSAHLPVGQLTYVNRMAPHSVVNCGDHDAIFLLLDVPVSQAPTRSGPEDEFVS